MLNYLLAAEAGNSGKPPPGVLFALVPVDLLNGTHHLSHYLPAFAVTAAVSAAALAIAMLRLRLREI